jgi:hypothetical protein
MIAENVNTHALLQNGELDNFRKNHLPETLHGNNLLSLFVRSKWLEGGE